MNGKRLILTAAFFSACTLFADILLEVRPGEIIKDQWQKDRGTFTTGSHPKNVTAGKEKQIGFARYCSDSNTYYKLKDMKKLRDLQLHDYGSASFLGKGGAVLCDGGRRLESCLAGLPAGNCREQGKRSPPMPCLSPLPQRKPPRNSLRSAWIRRSFWNRGNGWC